MSKVPGWDRYGGAPSPGIGMAPGGGQPLMESLGGLVTGIGGGELCSGSWTGVRIRSGGAVAMGVNGGGGGTGVVSGGGTVGEAHCCGGGCCGIPAGADL